MDVQINTIKSLTAASLMRQPLDLTISSLFKRLPKKISMHAFDMLRQQRKKMKAGKKIYTKDNCGCYLRRTHGLPCKCELEALFQKKGLVMLDQIHPFWRTLDLYQFGYAPEPEPTLTDLERLFPLASPEARRKSLTALKSDLDNDFFDVDEPPQIRQSNRARQSCSRIPSSWETWEGRGSLSKSSSVRKTGSRNSFIDRTAGEQMSISQSNDDRMSPAQQKSRASTGSDSMGTPTSRPPSGKVRGRGRGRGPPVARRLHFIMSEYAEKILHFVVPHIESYTDVVADGNCGFRCVALQLFGDENQWPQVRMDCCRSLRDNREIYRALNPWEDLDMLYNRIYHLQGPANYDHWMTNPEVGFVVATAYNAVLISYSLSDGITCFPVADLEGRGAATTTIVMGHVNGNHYISLQMNSHDEYPIPNVPTHWAAGRHITAPDLMPIYYHRIQAYNSLRGEWLRNRHGPYQHQGPYIID